ncbi:MAG: hypothetical protein ACP5N7_03205 [Candidatus Pacearchaeota archaeon]
MNAKNFIGLFVIAIAALFVVPAVSAQFATINYVETESFNILQGDVFAVEAGQTLDLRVVFDAIANAGDVRVTARVLGEPGLSDTTTRFDVIAGGTYSKQLSIDVPYDIDLNENFILEVRVENQNGGSTFTATFAVQRESYALEFLSVESPSRISAGEVLPIEVVVKNRGRYDAQDTFVIASIPALGISKKIFLEDLAANESIDNEIEDDSIEGRMLLAIPSNAIPGLYTVEVKTYNSDSETVSVRRVEIVSGNSNSGIIASPSSRTFAAGTDGRYTLTIVNSGNRILVYNLVTESDNGLSVDFDDSVVVVPAGSSKAVEMTAMAAREGNYNFKVTVLDSDNNVVSEKSFVANVEGRSVGGNAAVVLTIILAIVFVVLLVVLIVLLTRKPAKADSDGESYY